MTVRVGISGWTYPPWRGAFYPRGLAQARELDYAAGIFPTIEVNGTFYRLQRPETFADWYRRTPAAFVFAIKGPRFITHMKRLAEPRRLLANFFASGVLRLDEKLGPLLWQLPPRFRFEPARVEPFLAALPQDAEAALSLARGHDQRLAGRAWLGPVAPRPMRHAIEIRDESFAVPEFIAMLRHHRVALVVADTPAWPCLADVTAEFVYCRLHGAEELYASGYDEAALRQWAARVRLWARGGTPRDLRVLAPAAPRRGRDVYVYFDNDAKLRAPADAQALMRLLEEARP